MARFPDDDRFYLVVLPVDRPPATAASPARDSDGHVIFGAFDSQAETALIMVDVDSSIAEIHVNHHDCVYARIKSGEHAR